MTLLWLPSVAHVLAVAVFGFPFALTRSVGFQDDVAELVQEIHAARDSARPEDIERLAAIGSREAALGIVGAFEQMSSPFMRAEIVRALARFHGVAEAEEPALEKLVDVATAGPTRKLRLLAVEALGAGAGLGHQFLRRIVESPAEDEVRIEALRRHVLQEAAGDERWYQVLFDGEAERKATPNRTRLRIERDTAPETRELEVHSLPELRALAFEALLEDMSVRDLSEASEDRSATVRRKALVALADRDPKRALRRAQEVFERIDEATANRVLAAQVLAEARGPRIAADFIELGTKLVTPEQLRVALADLVAEFRDAGVEKKLVKLFGRGKAAVHERVFALRAVRYVEEPKVWKRVVEDLDARDVEVRLAAIEGLGMRGDPDAIPALEELVMQESEVEVMTAVMEALSILRADDPEWRASLRMYADHDDTVVRNAALIALGSSAESMPILVRALEHERWSTRRIAIQGLAAIGTKEVVSILIARLEHEDGRLLRELVDTLFGLTGKPFPANHRSWASWWQREGETFAMPSPEELERLREAADERAEKLSTKAQFLGVRIVSHRVVFVVDVSGSMAAPLRSRFLGDRAGEARMEVAKRELKAAIDSLEPATRFNLIAFSGGVDRWRDEGVGSTDEGSRSDAKDWADGLAPLGGTNLHGALEMAFDDPDVDTIFVLSDGEPSVGELIDPFAIRRAVERWNRHRGVIVHTVAIGTSLDVLAWLAEDSGGTYQEFR